MTNQVQNSTAPAKASIAMFLANLILKGLSFITMPIYTRLIPAEEYGTVSVFFSYMTLVGTVAMFCLSYGVFNNGMLEFENDKNGFTASLLFLSNVITTAVFIVFLIFRKTIINLSGLSLSLWLLMFFVFYTQPALNFWFARQRYEYKYQLSITISLLSSLISSIVAICCTKFMENKVYGRLFGGEIVLLFTYCIVYIYTVKKRGTSKATKYWKYAFKFNLSVLPHYLSLYVLTSSDRLMIKSLLGLEQAAFYSVAYSIGAVVLVVWTAINGSLIPYTYEKCVSRNYDDIKKTSNLILSFYGIACIGVMLFAPEILSLMAPKTYQSALMAIPPVVGGVFLQAHYSLFVNVMYYCKKPKFAMISSAFSAILNIILNLVLIPKFGIVAAGYTTLVSYLIQAILDYIVLHKMNMTLMYDGKKILLISIVVLSVTLSGLLIYKFVLLRIILIILILLLALSKKSIIINMVKDLKKKEN